MKKPDRGRSGFSQIIGSPPLIDDLNYASHARLYDNGVLVHVGITIAGRMVHRRNFVIGDTTFRQHDTSTKL
jgi:hypothetical protein